MFRKKKVMVIGAGISGEGAVSLLVRKNAKVFVFDDDSDKAKSLSEKFGVTHVNAQEFPKVLASCEYAVLSPGISVNSNIAVMALALGVRVISEIELGYLCCRGKVVAVTGTNGKSSMVRLVGALLSNCNQKAYVCGNIGKSFSEISDGILENDFAVVETSSFQLETVDEFNPETAILLNINPDHLDRHVSFDEYAKAKGKILKNMTEDHCVIANFDSLKIREIVEKSKAKNYYFSLTKPVEEGVYFDGEEIVAVTQGRRYCVGHVSDVCGIKTPIENALALLCFALAKNIQFGLVYKTLREFQPLPHTMQKVCSKGGVVYVDDSKGTNISATLCAVKNTDGNVVLICGGRKKGENYAELFGKLPKNIVSTVCFGENAEEFQMLSLSAGIESKVAVDVIDAVKLASRDIEQIGGTVLFSPATASFDCFKNYAERGDAFVRAVRAYAQE